MANALSAPRRIDPIVGKIVRKDDITEYKDGKFVINLQVETVIKNCLGIAMATVKRIVMFYELAERADVELKEGNLVCLDECSTQDRSYKSKTSGEEVLTSDVIAKQFMKLDQATFDAARKQLLFGSVSSEQTSDTPDF